MIAGMDEIVEYIKTLEKENKELKDKLNEKTGKLIDVTTRYIYLKEEGIEKLEKQIDKLKEKNKELKEFKQQVEEECGASVVCKKMIDEIRELQEELDILKETEYDFKQLKSTKEYDKYYEIDDSGYKDFIMEEDDFYCELSKIIWGSKTGFKGWIECLQSIKRYKSYYMKNRLLNNRIKGLKDYAKYRNELMYDDDPDELKQLNSYVDKM